LFRRISVRFAIHAFAVGLYLSASSSDAQPPEYQSGEPAPVYQRHAFEWGGHNRGKFDRRFDRRFHGQAPHVNSGWFQRPYPYHLDYYKMRYGGSYAPYFGNLYGPPQVVTAPPYYGPYYGGFEYANPGDGAFGIPNYVAPNGPILQSPALPTAPVEGSELPSPEK
jgi:hypothetical protein